MRPGSLLACGRHHPVKTARPTHGGPGRAAGNWKVDTKELRWIAPRGGDMTTRREDDNSGPPPHPEGSPRPVAGLPPEWGRIIIPDDAAELDHEAARIRRELRGAGRRHRWTGQGSLFRAPITIVLLTLLLALSSLFSIMGPLGRSPQTVEPDTDLSLREISLIDERGLAVRIGDHLPAVVLLLDGCPCVELGNTVAAAAPAGVSVLFVGTRAAHRQRSGDPPRRPDREGAELRPAPGSQCPPRPPSCSSTSRGEWCGYSRVQTRWRTSALNSRPCETDSAGCLRVLESDN